MIPTTVIPTEILFATLQSFSAAAVLILAIGAVLGKVNRD